MGTACYVDDYDNDGKDDLFKGRQPCIGLLIEEFGGCRMEPCFRQIGIELDGALKVSNRVRRTFGGGRQKPDLILIRGRLRRHLRKLLIERHSSIDIARRESRWADASSYEISPPNCAASGTQKSRITKQSLGNTLHF